MKNINIPNFSYEFAPTGSTAGGTLIYITDHLAYKSYRNMLSTFMKKSKQNYFTKFFENNLKNLKNTWKGIKSIISMKISFSNSPTLLTFQNENTDNPERIANIFFLLLIQNSKYLVSSSNPERIVNIFFLPERIANIF